MVQEKNINQSVPNYIFFMCMQKRDVDPRAAHIFARKEVEDLPWECLLLLRVGSIIQAGWHTVGSHSDIHFISLSLNPHPPCCC